MTSLRGEKMLSVLGIRLRKDGPNSNYKVLLGQESSKNTLEGLPVDSLAREICTAEMVSDSDNNKENSPLEVNESYGTVADTFTSFSEHYNEADKSKQNCILSAEITDYSISLETSCTSDAVIRKEVSVPSTNTHSSSSSSSNSSSTSDSSESDSDFSSDDSVIDPDYKRSTSSSSDSDDVCHENVEVKSKEEVTSKSAVNTESHSALSDLVEIDYKKKTRKRRSQPSTWNKNRTKRLRNSGKPYRTYNKGIEVPARSIKQPCDAEKCKQNCTKKFTEQERLALFESYWAMEDIVKQRTYIVTLMEDVNPAKEKNRINNHAFYFVKNGKKLRVCKLFFTSTLGITNRCIRTIISKKQEGSLGDDLRGKHDKHRQVPHDIKDGIRAHISSIPTIESHYTRAHSEKVYIEGGKTIAQLYRDYKADCQKENKSYAKFSMYRDIFNNEFNIAFFIPKKDQCQTCVSYNNSSDEERKKLEEAYIKHQEEKTLSREEKIKDKSMISPDYQVACFDLQAALPTPNGQVSSFYYKSKLSTYNFTVCHLDTKGQGSVYCFMWHEGEGKRGAIEIGTCLLRFLKETAERTNSENLEIILYSDNCSGQQKNKFVLAAFFYAVANYKIKSITQKYLVTGHTQNEGDNVHSLVEKNIKRALKSGPIYTPAQYVTIVQTAKKSGNPFKVIEFTHDDFVDLKKLTEDAVFKFNTNSEGHSVKFSDISIIKVEKEHTSKFFYKTSFKDIDFKSVNINNVRRTRNPISAPSFESCKLEKAYQDKIPIPKKKYEDLMFLVKSNAIIKSHSDFYVNLTFN